jgi:hypothetical protein
MPTYFQARLLLFQTAKIKGGDSSIVFNNNLASDANRLMILARGIV